ncbi:MAG: hypothetical protein WCX65_08380 [bacterium]
MKSDEQKEIIVVAPVKYGKDARRMANYISIKYGFKAEYLNVKQYAAEEGGDRCAVFIGNASENKLSKDCPEPIRVKHAEGGACWGYGGTKAYIYGDGEAGQVRALSKLIGSKLIIKNEAGEIDKLKTSKMLGPILTENLYKIFLKTPVATQVVLVSYLERNRSDRIMLQTKVAVELFLSDGFEEWAFALPERAYTSDFCRKEPSATADVNAGALASAEYSEKNNPELVENP